MQRIIDLQYLQETLKGPESVLPTESLTSGMRLQVLSAKPIRNFTRSKTT